MPFKVKLTIFKPSGKYYTDGEYVSDKKHIHEIFEEVRTMALERRLPGLCPGSTTPWMVLISAPDHPQDHPHIVVTSGGELERMARFHAAHGVGPNFNLSNHGEF